MSISAARKARTRAEIADHAARLFRLRGHAGTNIDDIMLAAGLTRGAFYAHFTSKDDLFAEIVRMGHGLLAKLRAGVVEAALDDYLDREKLAANAQTCTLAALAGDVARAPLLARLAYANVLYALIGELARGRSRKLDADATAAAILAVGAVALAHASGDTRLSDWLLRCARRATATLLKSPPLRRRRGAPKGRRGHGRKRRPGASDPSGLRPPSRVRRGEEKKIKRQASPAKRRSTSHRKAAGARRSIRAARSRGGRGAA